ncbi:hypothetical protein OAK38_06585 [Verrucomicrobia bacterium]|nr:hypothetical protein [Verrucomicrobiota bacterium]
MKKNLSSDCVGFFEPLYDSFLKEVMPCLDKGKQVCVKVLLRPYLDFKTDFEGRFDQVMGLVRDPRDNLISRLLFRMVSPAFVGNGEVYNDMLPLFEEKVENPDSISVCDLFSQMEKTKLMEPMIQNRARENLDLFMDWHSNSPDCIIYKYEEFVRGNYDKIALITQRVNEVDATPVETIYPQIKRSGKTGDWRQWFLQSDVEFFRPRFSKYMKIYGYEDEWDLPEKQRIDRSTSIDYVRKYAKL